MFFRLSILIARVNLARAQRIQSFKTLNTKVGFLFVNKLEQLGIIRGFEVEEDMLVVYMKYVNKCTPFTKIKLISKPSRRYPISLQHLMHVSDRNGSSIFILATGRGFLTHTECLSKRCSGDLVAKIDL